MNGPIKFIHRVHRRLRAELGVPCRDNWELDYRLNRLPEPAQSGTKFSFPWGNIEYVSASDLRGQFWEIYRKRHYAFESLADHPVIIDAGGNIGMSAIWFKQTYPNSFLTVYEADPALAETIRRNLAATGIKDVTVHHAAVWNEEGFVTFDNAGADKGSVAPGGAIKVPSIDLSQRLPERVDLLKLDVEGAEFGLVEKLSADGTLARVQHLVAEYHIKRADTDRFLESLRLLRASGMQVTFTAEMGPWLGRAAQCSPIEVVGDQQTLAEVYAWR